MIINPKTKERVINLVNAFIYGDKVFVKQTVYHLTPIIRNYSVMCP